MNSAFFRLYLTSSVFRDNAIEFISMWIQSTPPAGDAINIDLGDIEE